MMMKKALIAVMLMGVVSFFAPVDAHAYLTNWYFNPSGTGYSGAVKINEYLDMVGFSLIEVNPTTGTFAEGGVLEAVKYDGYGSFPSTANQFTSVFTAAGTLTGSDSFSFTSGNVYIYSDASKDYATAGLDGSLFQADDTTAVGKFTVVAGGGDLNSDYTPNGWITAVLQAYDLDAGYFFDENGNDLSQWTLTSGNLPTLTLGFFTTNGSVITSPSSVLVGEFAENLGDLGLTGQAPVSFIVSNNGQFRVDVVPEPATMVMFGLGIAGLAGLRRKK